MAKKHSALLMRTYVILVFCFMYLPIAVMIAFSFNESKSRSNFTGFTLGWYKSLFHNEMILSALGLSLVLALVSSIIATVLGTLATLGINSMSRKSQLIINNISYVPVVNPEIITGVSLMLLFVMAQNFGIGGESGIFGWPTLLIAHITFNIPYVIFNVGPKLRQLDPSLYNAALDLGCTPRQAFTKVIMPQLSPAILSAFLICLTYSIDDFMISYFNSGTMQTLPIAIYSMTRKKVSPEINALSAVIFCVILAIILISNAADSRAYRRNQKAIRKAMLDEGGALKMKLKKFSAAALAALTVTMMSAAPVLAADDIEVNEDISVSGDYDWKRFANDHITLNVYNNGLYISDGSDESINVLSAFEELTGIKVNYTTYDSNESLYAKLKSGGVSYDVIFPSDYMVGKMAKEGMLSELNMDNIPNFAGIGETYLDRSFDPGNKYSVPYMWGTTGLIYNTTMVEEPPTKWADMWDVAYTNNVLMFNNSRDAYAIAAKTIGLSMNPQSVDEITAITDALKAQKNIVQAYVMDEVFDKMEGGEAAMAPYYAGDAITMIDENPDLAFVHPEEGVNFFIDSMCIPANAKHREAAEMFINYLCEPDVGLANADFIGYSTPITAVWEMLDDDLKYSEIAYPSAEVLDKAEVFETLPDDINAAMDAQWSEMKSYEDGGSGWMVLALLLLAIAISAFNIWRKLRKKSRDNY